MLTYLAPLLGRIQRERVATAPADVFRSCRSRAATVTLRGVGQEETTCREGTTSPGQSPKPEGMLILVPRVVAHMRVTMRPPPPLPDEATVLRWRKLRCGRPAARFAWGCSIFDRSPTPAVRRAVVLAVGSGGSPLQFAFVHAFSTLMVPHEAHSASRIARIHIFFCEHIKAVSIFNSRTGL